MTNIQLKILDSRIKDNLPNYATEFSAGIDLRAVIDQELIIHPNQTILINTGIAIFINDPNYVGLIVPRSGLGHKHGIVTGNLVGVIDADYQGQIMVSLWNRSSVAYAVQPLDRIAQLLITPVIQAKFNLVDEFNVNSTRGNGGFGSTGSN